MSEEQQRSFAIEVAEGFARIAKEYREASQSEVPMAIHLLRFQGGGESPEVVRVDPSPFGGDKEALAMGIRAMVQVWGARYVIMVNEAWASIGEGAEEITAIEAWTAAGNSLETYPGRREILMVSLDGPDVSLLISADINPDGSVGELDRLEDPTLQGRLANLSHPQETKHPELWN